MNSFKKTPCELCFKNVTEKGFQVIDDGARDILDVLSLKLKSGADNKEIICNLCRRKLSAALEFKTACLNTDYRIIPHVDFEKTFQIDMEEVFEKENGCGYLTDPSHNYKICRLCMHVIKGETKCIGEEELEAIKKFVPEINIMMIRDPVICKPCFDSLCIHSAFLEDCLEAKQENKDIFESSATQTQMGTFLSDLLIKTENLDEFEINEEGMSIKAECVDIKSEENEESYTLLLGSNNQILESSYCKDAEEEGLKHMPKSSTLQQPALDNLYKCDKCSYGTASKKRFTTHRLKHKHVTKVYKSEIFKYVTKKKRTLSQHKLKDKGLSEVQTYRCNDCEYESKDKRTLTRHVLQHKDPSRVQMYKCNVCNYESRHRRDFKVHQLIHKDPSEVQMYKCNCCDYQTKHRTVFAHHALRHKDSSHVQMYKCNTCNYESRHKRYLTYHQLIHKDASQVQIYKCDVCDYESIYKSNFTKHQVKHKDLSEAGIYKCNDCDYKTKYKTTFARHVLRHRYYSLYK